MKSFRVRWGALAPLVLVLACDTGPRALAPGARRAGIHSQFSSGSPPSDITTLVTALGGNVAVIGFYDGRGGVTDSAGFATAWLDARGASGFGPPLMADTLPGRPTWDSVGGKLSMFYHGRLSTPQGLTSAPSGLYSLLTPVSLIYVGVAPTPAASGWGRGVVAIASNDILIPGPRVLEIHDAYDGYSDSLIHVLGGRNEAVALNTRAKSNDSTVQVIVATNSHLAITAQVADSPTVAAAITAPFPGPNRLTVGARHLGSTLASSVDPGSAKAYAVIVVNHVLSANEVNAVVCWAIANHNATVYGAAPGCSGTPSNEPPGMTAQINTGPMTTAPTTVKNGTWTEGTAIVTTFTQLAPTVTTNGYGAGNTTLNASGSGLDITFLPSLPGGNDPTFFYTAIPQPGTGWLYMAFDITVSSNFSFNGNVATSWFYLTTANGNHETNSVGMRSDNSALPPYAGVYAQEGTAGGGPTNNLPTLHGSQTYGADYPNLMMSAGTSHHVEVLSSPESSPGKGDGGYSMWVDGQLGYSSTTVQWLGAGDTPGWDGLKWEWSFGGGPHSPPATQTITLNNLYVSTK
jgi:hypothetical protein